MTTLEPSVGMDAAFVVARSSERRGPIFIGGLDRSGKTTMRAFLASHPNISIPAVGSNMETYFYRRFGDLAAPRNFERCLQAMLRYKHVRFLNPDAERIRSEFRQGPATYGRLFSLFLIHHAEREGKARWGAQTGLIERYADHLFEAYPGAKVIHMIRDPRDRYEASLALWPDGKGRAGGATARWRYSTRLAKRNRRRYPDAYRIVRFEDLVTNPEGVIRDLCRFLDEPFVQEMLEMPAAEKHMSMLAAGAALDGAGPPLSTRFIGGYRGAIPAEEIAFIQLHAGREMRALGYRVESPDLAVAGWLRFAALGWPNQAARMIAWRTVEAMHQLFPRVAPRRPATKMIVDGPPGGSS